MRRARILALALPLLAGPLGDTATAQDAIRLDIAEARKMAAILLNEGELNAARQMAHTLLRRNPKDFDALIILAQAEISRGRLAAAAAAGRRAFAVADTDPQKYLAANVTAGALNQMGALTRAQVWLRRAAQVAPNEALEQRTAREYRGVRAANPLSFNLSLSARPSSNINNGSDHEREVFGGFSRDLTGAEQALSGMEYGLGFDIRYRLSETDRSQTSVVFSGDARLYTLSDDAKAQAPTVRASDFAYRGITVGLSHRRTHEGNTAETKYALTFGQNWTGDTARARTAEVAITHRRLLNDRTQVQLRGAIQQNWRLDQRRDDATLYSASAALSYTLPSAGRLTLQGGVAHSDSISYRTAYDSAHVSLSYDFANPILGADVTLWAAIQTRDFALPFIIFDPRKDTRSSVGASLFFRDMNAYGFAPTIDVGFARNKSNVGAYDGRSLSVGLGLKSTF